MLKDIDSSDKGHIHERNGYHGLLASPWLNGKQTYPSWEVQRAAKYQVPPLSLLDPANPSSLRGVLESEEWSRSLSRIPVVLGKDNLGKSLVTDLAKMPHCLIGGTTGSGKSACLDTICMGFLFRFPPDKLRLIMIDAKGIDLPIYNRVPHLMMPVATSPDQILFSLRWTINEIENRYNILAKEGVRDIAYFNARVNTRRQVDIKADERLPSDEENETKTPKRIPYLVVIIDGLQDLDQRNVSGHDFGAAIDLEKTLARIVQMGRAVGVHLIVTSPTSSTEILTGRIRSNIPARIAFRLNSAAESVAFLDESGAQQLLGQGNFLYRSPQAAHLIQSRGILVTEREIRKVVNFVSDSGEPIDEGIAEKGFVFGAEEEGSDELLETCLEVFRQENEASVSVLQRRLRLGYSAALQIVTLLEERGFLGAGEGSKPREILLPLE